MTGFSPINLQIIDENGNQTFSQSVPYEWEMDVKQVMERAFVLSQSPATPDPLVYTLQYYGYSETPQFPGYMGYELESIGTKGNNQEFFWQLLINGNPSQLGADLEQPAPGSTVVWQYTPIPSNPQQMVPRSSVLHARRVASHRRST